MYEGWDSFYLLVGGAAGALIGLLFVVATLTRGRDRDSALRGASVYMSPLVLQLAVVLVISALATAPSIGVRTGAVIMGICALVAAATSARVVYHLARGKIFATAHWTDLWCYGVATLVADLALLGSAAAGWLVSREAAAEACAISLVAILLIAIRNAWDLVTWISAINNAGETPDAPS